MVRATTRKRAKYMKRTTRQHLLDLALLFKSGQTVSASNWAHISQQNYEMARQQLRRFVTAGIVERKQSPLDRQKYKFYVLAPSST